MSTRAAIYLILTLWAVVGIASVVAGDWSMLAIAGFMCLIIVPALCVRHRWRPPGES